MISVEDKAVEMLNKIVGYERFVKKRHENQRYNYWYIVDKENPNFTYSLYWSDGVEDFFYDIFDILYNYIMK